MGCALYTAYEHMVLEEPYAVFEVQYVDYRIKGVACFMILRPVFWSR